MAIRKCLCRLAAVPADMARILGGGAGGGGVEIVATGNVTFGSNAEIYSEGGSVMFACHQYPAAAVPAVLLRIIADGNFTNNGIIDVNGGKGGNGNEKANNTGGGGGGGRVAIFYGGTIHSDTGSQLPLKAAKEVL